MTQEEILEGNKLIAEFMGLRKIMLWGGVDFLYDIEKESYVTYVKVGSSGINATINTRVLKARPDELLFHSSWDWLMPVVEKIESLEHITEQGSYGNYYLTLFKNYGSICYGRFRIGDVINGEGRLSVAYKVVIEFIKWHKTQIK